MRASFIIARLTLIETLRRQIELITFFIAIGITEVIGSTPSVLTTGSANQRWIVVRAPSNSIFGPACACA